MIGNYIDTNGNRYQAVQFKDKNSKDEISEFMGIEVEKRFRDEGRVRGGVYSLEIPTEKGIEVMNKGDYLVKGEKSDWDYKVIEKQLFEDFFTPNF